MNATGGGAGKAAGNSGSGKFDFDAIKARIKIADVIGGVVPLKRKGNVHEGCCPFHQERTPSFKVYDDHYHCFGCGAHGDVVDFITETQGVNAAEAIDRLGAGDYKLDAPAKAAIKERDKTREREIAAAIIQARSRWEAAEPAPAANAYLARKGIRPHMARSEGPLLLIPVYDRGGDIQSVQTIAGDGAKLFQFAAPVKGGRLYFGIAVGRSIICEGFATAASIYESVADRVCVAFSANGVKEMAREFADAGLPFVIAADRKAAADMIALGRELLAPVYFPPGPYDDFNDLASADGHDAVADILRGPPCLSSPEPEAPNEPEPASDNDPGDDPVDIWAKAVPPALLPGILPPILERFAMARARMIGADPGGLSMAALTVCGAMISDTIKLKVKRNENWSGQTIRCRHGRTGSRNIYWPAKLLALLRVSHWALARLGRLLGCGYAAERCQAGLRNSSARPLLIADAIRSRSILARNRLLVSSRLRLISPG